MRSLLFVPGDDERKLVKALSSEADALIVDLEGPLALAAKPGVRGGAAAFLREARRRSPRPRLIVRVSPLGGEGIDADLAAVMPEAPDAIMLPQCLGGASVQQLGVRLAVHEAEQGLADGATRIIAMATESARALFGFASYIGCSRRLEGLAWGGQGLSADLGAESDRLADGAVAAPYALARALMLIGAAAAGVGAIDAAFADFRDIEGLAAEARAARRDGFVAKLAIHPGQVAIINAVFTPSAEAVARAKAVVAAFAAEPGADVVSLDGERLDLAHWTRAKATLTRAGLE
ncbi:MAG: CoA ester lyase [Roseiarcus sp.]|jgi:citrate lyase subunit beta/citryl-CoA lyase